jgi:uncharacterized protein YggE
MKLHWIGMVAVLGALPLVAQTMQPPSLQVSKDNRTLSISASGQAKTEPDVADLNVGFTVYGPTLKAAYKTASDTSNGVVKAMLDAGAARADIQSQSQQVNRLQDYEMKAQKGMKFSVQQSWTVSVAPKDAALILDAAVEAGANQSGDINWRLKNSVALDEQAISRATERAHALAAAMAKSMGVTLGKPIYATNSVNSSVIAPRMMFHAVAGLEDKSPAPLAIQSREVESNATVEIVYAIE